MPQPVKSTRLNGHAVSGLRATSTHAGSLACREALRDAFEQVQRGTDEICIRSSIESHTKIETATMADAAKLIESVKYLVRDWIPYGMVTGFIAEPGVGKSAFALWLARTLMVGGTWFNGTKGPEAGPILWCPTENDMAITKDRMEKWGLPFDKLLLPFPADAPLASINLLNDEHLLRMEEIIGTYKTKAAFVDSLRGSHDGDENSSTVGKVLQNLAAIAERTGAAIGVVHHTKKLMEGEEVSANSSRGSNSITALFRAQLGFDKPDPESQWVRVRMLKQNLGLAPAPFGMRVTGTGLEFGEAPRRPEKDTQKASAIDWLQQRLSDGKWHLRNDVMADAAQFDFSANAIQRAREELGITQDAGTVRKRPTDKLYEWKLPRPTQDS
jgi:hypothetical protein